MQALLAADGGNAVVSQLMLWLNQGHVVGVLARDNGVVAAHVLQVEQPTGVGVQRLLTGRVVGGEAPGALVLLQELHHRWGVLQRGRVAAGIEAVARDEQIGEKQPQQRRPPVAAMRARGFPKRQPAQQQQQPQLHQPACLIREEHARICERAVGPRQLPECALDYWFGARVKGGRQRHGENQA